MFRLLGKFRLTNEVQFLQEVLVSYGELRPRIRRAIAAETTAVRLIGWGTLPFRRKLFRELAAQDENLRWSLRRRLRFDLRLVYGRRSIMWGYEMRSTKRGELGLDLHHTIQRSRAQHALSNSSELGIVDRVWYEVRGNQLRSELEKAFPLLVELFEVTGDFELAELTAINFSKYGLTDLEIQKLNLLAGGELIPSSGLDASLGSQWRRVPLRSVSWQFLDRQKKSGTTPVFTRTDFGYESQFGVSISRNVPKPKFAHLKQVEVGDMGLVTQDGALLDLDPVRRPHRGFVAGQWQFAVGSSARLNEAMLSWPVNYDRQVAAAIVLIGRADANWFHWTIETLPRLAYCEFEVDSDVPILISSNVSDAGVQALRAVTQRQLIRMHPSETVGVAEAFIPGPNVYHSDLEIEGWDAGLGVDFGAIEWVRNRLVAVAGKLDEPVSKIYWARSGGIRGIRNIHEVDSVIERAGYTRVVSDKLSLWEQIRLVNGATHFISPGGAAMANFQFLNQSTSVLMTASEYASQFPMPAHLALNFGHSYSVVEGVSIARPFEGTYNDLLHRDYHVPLAALRMGLSAIES